MKEALALLEYPEGPVLADYPIDCDEYEDTAAPLTCPVNFQNRPQAESSTDTIINQLRAELSTMQTWYDLAHEIPEQATTGASGLVPPEIVDFFDDFINNRIDSEEMVNQKIPDLLRLAAEDLKAFYFKAVSAQPGQSTDVAVLANWFWGDTYAAACINEVRTQCLTRETNDFQLAGKLLLVPRSQMHRFDQSS